MNEKVTTATEARAEAELLYEALERVLDCMGTAAVDASQDEDLRQLLSDTAAVAESALAAIERRGASNGECHAIDSVEAYGVMRRFCHAQLNMMFSVDVLRDHLERNGVIVSDLDDNALLAGFDALAPRIMADLKKIHKINMTRYEDGAMTAFCEIANVETRAESPQPIVPSEIEQPTQVLLMDPDPAIVAEPTEEQLPPCQEAEVDNGTANEKDAQSLGVDLTKLENAVRVHLLADVVAVPRGAAIKFLSSRSSQFTPNEIEAAMAALVEQGRLHRYREGGRSWFTFDSNLAQEKKEAAREVRNAIDTQGEVETEADELIDYALAERVLGVFIGPNTHVQRMLTIKEVWLAMYDGVSIDDRAFTADVARDIRDVARRLSDCHIMTTGTRGQNRGALSRSANQRVFKMGLTSQKVKETLRSTQNRSGTLIPLLERYLQVETRFQNDTSRQGRRR